MFGYRLDELGLLHTVYDICRYMYVYMYMNLCMLTAKVSSLLAACCIYEAVDVLILVLMSN